MDTKDLSDEDLAKVAEIVGVEASEDLRCLREMQKYADQEAAGKQARIDTFAKKFFIGAFVIVQKEFLINTMFYKQDLVGEIVGRDGEKCIIKFSLTPYITVNINPYFSFVEEYFVVLTWR